MLFSRINASLSVTSISLSRGTEFYFRLFHHGATSRCPVDESDKFSSVYCAMVRQQSLSRPNLMTGTDNEVPHTNVDESFTRIDRAWTRMKCTAYEPFSSYMRILLCHFSSFDCVAIGIFGVIAGNRRWS